MAAALKFCGQKGIDQLHGQALPHHTLPEGEDVGVIVGSCHAGAEGIGAAAGPDALHLIGGDGHPHARPADENSSLGVSVPQIAGHLGGLFGVIALFTGLVDAEILDLVAQFQQMRLYGVLQGQGSVVAAYDDLHITTLLWCKIYLVYAGARGRILGQVPGFSAVRAAFQAGFCSLGGAVLVWHSPLSGLRSKALFRLMLPFGQGHGIGRAEIAGH